MDKTFVPVISLDEGQLHQLKMMHIEMEANRER